MATEAFENFQAVVTSLAATGAAYVAWLGLNTWKKQLRWQEGRGLAADILQTFQASKRALNDFRSIGRPQYDDLADSNTRQQKAEVYSKAVENYLTDLSEKIIAFERRCIEAKVLWRIDLSFASNELNDLKHIVNGGMRSAAAALYPEATKSARESHWSAAEQFFGIMWGYNRDEPSMSARIVEVEQKVDAALPLSELS